MNNKLNQLADFLETIKADRFNMNFWASGQLNECGTIGCAVGWATQIFPELKLVETHGVGETYLIVCFNGLLGFDALTEFFRITYAQSSYIFDPDYYPSRLVPKDLVIKHIREVSNEN